ncbi:hypothetical protein JCM6882_003031 [Rhodosporidiobolus microsporus]
MDSPPAPALPQPGPSAPPTLAVRTKGRGKGGCLTCRNRKKKCDKTKLAEHGCERCYTSSFVCEWPPTFEQRPLKVFRSRAAAATAAAMSSGSTASEERPTFAPAPPALPSVLAGPSTESVPMLAAHTVSDTSNLPLPPPPPPAALANNLPSPSYTFPFPVPTPDPSTAFSPATISPRRLLLPLQLPLPFFDPFDPSNPLIPPSSSLPPQHATPPPAALDAPTPNFLDCLPHPLPSPPQPALPLAELAHLDPLYLPFTQGLSGSTSDAGRVSDALVRLAASTALGRHAAQAMVTLVRIHHLRSKEEHLVQPHEAALFAQRREQLQQVGYAHFEKGLDHLMRDDLPLANRLLGCVDLLIYQFEQYGAQAAQAMLFLSESFITQALGPRPLLNFLAKDAKTDLLLPSAWKNIVYSMRTKRPTLFAFRDLPGDSIPSSSSASSSSTSSPVSSSTAAEADASPPWSAPPNAYSPHPCLPLTFMLSVAAIVNLDAERENLAEETVRRKAREIERAVRGWRAPPPEVVGELGGEEEDSAFLVEKMATVEMWRHAIIIFLYQTIHGHSPLSRVLSFSARQIFKLGAPLLSPHAEVSSYLSISDPYSLAHPSQLFADPTIEDAKEWARTFFGLRSCRDGPWFLAGTCATLPSDRALVRRAILSAGPHAQGYKDNVAALERIWHETDESGRWLDWREVLQREGMCVGFY